MRESEKQRNGIWKALPEIEITDNLSLKMRYDRTKRLFDAALSVLLFALFSVPMILIASGIKATSPGPVIYWSSRVGVRNRLFQMPKFRTMRIDTPAMATHLLKNSKFYVTRMGAFLRKTSFDELPQLISVLKGEMSFVGPRPALYNQDDLVALRTAKGIHEIVPGVTGWAQINGRDDLSIPDKVTFEEYYLKHRSFRFDLRIIALTLMKVFQKEGITH